MNSYEAKKGFFTFLILLLTVVGMSVFVNFVLTQSTSSEIKATSSVISVLPQNDLIILIGIPVLIIGIIVTAIKRAKRKYL